MHHINIFTKTLKRFIKPLFYLAAGLSFFVIGFAYADTPGGSNLDLGTVASNITDSMASLAKLISAMSYVLGMGFAVGAVFKFKAHKDNPTQIPVGTPIALIFIAAVLIFLPSIFDVAGTTLFGSDAQVADVTGDNPYTQE
jgi:intracellular multiplication protein IcmD